MTNQPVPSPRENENYNVRWFLLAPAVWLLLFIAPAIWGMGSFHEELNSTDDYMRIVQVRDFLSEPGNSSFVQDRLGPEGAPSMMHWTRIVDLPLSGLVLALRQITTDEQAAYITAAIVPAILTAILLLLGWWYTKPFTGPKRAFTAIVVTALLWPTLRQFLVGGIDHHAWQILLALGAYGYIVRSAQQPEHRVAAIAAGAFFGLGLSIGAEILPWIAMAGMLQAWFWLVYGHNHFKNGLYLGLAMLATTSVLFAAFRFPWEGLRPACDTLSPVFLLFSAAPPAFWLLAVPFHKWTVTVPRRLIVGSICGVAVLAAIIMIVPDCLRDPYAITDPKVRDIWLSQVTEAKPWLVFIKDNAMFGFLSFLPVFFGTAGCIWAAVRERDRWPLWIGFGIIIVLSFTLTLIIQTRFGDFTSAIAIGPCTWFLTSAFTTVKERIGERYGKLRSSTRIIISFIFFLCCLALFTIRFTNFRQQEETQTETTATEETENKADLCLMSDIARALADLPPGTIAAFVDSGPELLFRSSHRVLSAPYHNNIAGIIAAFDILAAATDEEALKTVKSSGTDYILVCPQWKNYWKTHAPEDGSNLALRLMDGEAPPWLREVEIPGEGTARLFMVLKETEDFDAMSQ